MITADTITDEQIREYGYIAMTNGNHIDVRRAHLALAVPPVSWEPAWADPTLGAKLVHKQLNMKASDR